MATTPNYAFNMPLVGGDRNTWGTQLNANWASIDTKLKTANDKIAALESGKVDSSALTNLVRDLIFPVGALHVTAQNVNPSARFPGTTWVAAAGGRAIVGVGTADSLAWTVKQTRGAPTTTLSEANLPSHNHTVNPSAVTVNTGNNSTGHTHAADPGSSTFTTSTDAHTHTTAATTSGSAGSHDHTMFHNAQSSGVLDSKTPVAYRVVGSGQAYDYQMAPSSGGAAPNIGETGAVGNHTHSIPAQTTSSDSHNHTVAVNLPSFTTGGESNTHTHSVTVDIPSTTSSSVGSGTSFNNVQSSIAYYIWERTA
jgi:hypothetical protein